ncbi:MAG: TIGR02710 family CRISPR-associated CARF protein [Candidatus Brocadiaceae bacterium]|nr:TIGR02710 family CRISPR-associated CARF protein [Candidatus Brocadiaceae bacterium]
MNRILIITIGGSHQPILKSLHDMKPDFTVFLCSDDIPTQKGSYTQITDRVAVKKDCETSYLPNIPTQAGLKEDTWELRKIKYFDNLDECYRMSLETIHEMRQRFESAEIVIDYTGGTKTMTAGLTAAALDDGKCKIVLVSGTRSDLHKVTDKTEYVKPVAAFDTLAAKNIAQLEPLLERFDYSGAVSILQDTIILPLGNEKRQEVQTYLLIYRGFDAWDRFNHARAYDFLNPYRKYLVQYLIPLEIMKNTLESKETDYLIAEDIIFNAERRAAQGRYEDAVGRIYRAIEMIAQIRLKKDYQQSTDDVSMDALSILGEAWKDRLEKNKNDDTGKIQTGLRMSYELLVALDDGIFKPWYTENKNRIIDFLTYRNNSLFAHGFSAINSSLYEEKVPLILEKISLLLKTIYKSEKKKRIEMVQLPQSTIQLTK